MNEDTYFVLFQNASEALRSFYIEKVLIKGQTLGKLLQNYITCADKIKRSERINL
jgi:hypothetical protein